MRRKVDHKRASVERLDEDLDHITCVVCMRVL
jgi:hypothetical protein